MTDRRLSKLSTLPPAFALVGWLALAVAVAATLVLTTEAPWIWGLVGPTQVAAFVGWLAAPALSLAAMLTGGASGVRVHQNRGELRGRGVAAAGCLAAVPPLLVSGLVVALPLTWVVWAAGFLLWWWYARWFGA